MRWNLKEDGGKRIAENNRIITDFQTVDWVFQQAITKVLSPIYEERFSENSFGFRTKRGAHGALKQCQQNVDDGYVYIVRSDLGDIGE